MSTKIYTKQQLATVTQHFLVACMWADSPEGTSPRITKASEYVAREFCRDFIEASGDLFTQAMQAEGFGSHPDAGSPEAAFGHDLWLTSQGNGAGFWDREALQDFNNIGQALTSLYDKPGINPPSVDFYRGWLNLTRWDPETCTMYPTKAIGKTPRK